MGLEAIIGIESACSPAVPCLPTIVATLPIVDLHERWKMICVIAICPVTGIVNGDGCTDLQVGLGDYCGCQDFKGILVLDDLLSLLV